jgi:hypothetical protein
VLTAGRQTRTTPQSLDRRVGSTAAAFVLTFVGLLVYTLLEPAKTFYYDASVYWGLADTFETAGHFSLLNFDSPLRGYALPLVDHFLRELADGLGWNHSSAAKLFNVAVFSALATVLIPSLARIAFPAQPWGLLRRLGLAALLLVFWGGYLPFPLSDFPALAAATLALIAIARAPTAGWMALAGVSAALAINMRPSYVLLGPILAGLFLWSWVAARRTATGRPLAHWAVGAVLVMLGFVAISLPQSLATQRHHGSYSFLPGSTQNLSGFQLTMGLRLQRYETFVGTGQPSPAMNYVDEAGSRVLTDRPDSVVPGSREYLDLFVSHPLTMIGVWTRHVVNGLDQRYSTPYIEQIATPSRNPIRLLGFLLVFAAVVRMAWPAARRRLGPARWRYVAALPACCLTSIPSAMETRFLLPIYLTAWLLVLAGLWPNPLAGEGSIVKRLRTPAIIGAALLAFLALVVPIASRATETLHFG